MSAPREQAPKARQEGIVVKELPGEVLVYDLERHQAHCLNGVAAAVWRSCDGRASVAEIASRLRSEVDPSLHTDVVRVALRRLDRARLLETPVRLEGPGPSLARRELLRRVAAVGGLSVLSITVPTAAHAITCIQCIDCENTAQKSGCPGRPCCDGPNAGALCVAGGGGRCCTCGGSGKAVCGGGAC